ncbi:transglutaminase [Legionella cardiaca]|uniref:Transglutaminase n=1 Tax=Legionella cardiaca TaxID=1071983 RepID=A0ABY8AT19_9GAMM|nr:transglutaminase [Legionella cardiaca]WED42456.1 transglutaminase [Legionella cardiaca]
MILILTHNHHKKIYINKEFESNLSIPNELLDTLSGLKRDNEERFNMLATSQRVVVFKDVAELHEEMKRFKILKQYEKDFSTSFLMQMYTMKLANLWGSDEAFVAQLEIRDMVLKMKEADPLKQEIIIKLCQSSRQFKSIERLKEEIAFRFNAVKLMDNDKLHLAEGGYQYPTQEKNYLQLDSDYWVMPNKSRGFFRLKTGVKPSEAIRSIFDDTRLVVLECHSFMLCIQYKALLDTIGSRRFNLLFTKKPLIIADGFNLAEQDKDNLQEIIPYIDHARKEALIPGDWLYLANFPEYHTATLYDSSKNGSGLHSMFMGNNTYRGFGTPSAMTEIEIKRHFLEIYNEDFCAYPLKISAENIDDKTMGLDKEEQNLTLGEKVIIHGHIDCPELEWKSVECTYLGNGKFNCNKLMLQNASEADIVLALLEKFNSLLPTKKTEDDLISLNIFRSLLTNVRGMDFSGQRFDEIFPKPPSGYETTGGATLFTQRNKELATTLNSMEYSV